MGIGKILTILIILVINFILMIFLETKLEKFFVLELVIIVVGILLALILLAGLAAKAKWAWPFATIFFSLSLANTIFLFWNIKAWISFLLLLFFNTFGLLMSAVSEEETDEDWEPEISEPVETFEPKQVEYAATEVKPAKKKKR